MKKLYKLNQIFIIIFFSSIFIIGSFVFLDYGISIDEDNSRFNGFVSLQYILSLLNSNLLEDLKQIINVPQIDNYFEQGNGVVFDLPLALLELIFKINDSRQIFLLKHFFTFLIFFLSLIFFYLIIRKRFNSYLFGIIGVLFLFLSPRIFSQSFYNSKDIIFMSFNIFNIYFGIKYLENSNLKNTIFFSIISGLSIGTRLLGVYLPILFFIFKLIQILRSKIKQNNQFLNLLICLILVVIFTYIFFPYLWADPVTNFSNAFSKIGNIKHGQYNLFLGESIPSEYVPWNYSIVWILVSNPLSYVCLFIIGLFIAIRRIFLRLLNIDEKKNRDLWRGDQEKMDLLFFLNIFVPLITIIIIHSSLYNGWRHLYFIYPSLIFFSVYSLKFFKELLIKNTKIFLVVCLLIFTPNILWMVNNHPFQYVYFNVIFGKNFNKYFDMDYWGVTNYHSLKLIIDKNKNNKKSYIGIIGNGDLNLAKSFLSEEERKRIIISEDLNEIEYLIDGYVRWDGLKLFKKELLNEHKFDKYYDFEVNGIPINSIYKKRLK